MGRPGNSIYFLGWAWYDVAWGEDEEINALALGRFVNISKLWIRQYQP